MENSDAGNDHDYISISTTDDGNITTTTSLLGQMQNIDHTYMSSSGPLVVLNALNYNRRSILPSVYSVTTMPTQTITVQGSTSSLTSFVTPTTAPAISEPTIGIAHEIYVPSSPIQQQQQNHHHEQQQQQQQQQQHQHQHPLEISFESFHNLNIEEFSSDEDGIGFPFPFLGEEDGLFTFDSEFDSSSDDEYLIDEDGDSEVHEIHSIISETISDHLPFPDEYFEDTYEEVLADITRNIQGFSSTETFNVVDEQDEPVTNDEAISVIIDDNDDVPSTSVGVTSENLCSCSDTPPSKRKRYSTDTTPQSILTEEDDDGSICSICFEQWDKVGEHRLVALKCGHLFGHSCIRRWLNESVRQSGEKYCPHCKAKASDRDIRFLYARKLAVVDRTEEIRLRERLTIEANRNESLLAELSAMGKCLRLQQKENIVMKRRLQHYEYKEKILQQQEEIETLNKQLEEMHNENTLLERELETDSNQQQIKDQHLEIIHLKHQLKQQRQNLEMKKNKDEIIILQQQIQKQDNLLK